MPSRDRDSDTGLYVSDVSDSELVTFVATNPPVTTSTVADRFEWTARNARRRLERLADDGEIASSTVGSTKQYRPTE